MRAGTEPQKHPALSIEIEHALAAAPDFQHFLRFVEKSERGVIAGR